jgi:hypothetical protein
MNSSEDYQNLILRYIDGDLNAKKTQQIKLLLKENPQAQAFYLGQKNLDSAFAKSFAKTTLSENFQNDLLEKTTDPLPQLLVSETPTIKIIFREFLKQLSSYQSYLYSGLLILLLIAPNLNVDKLNDLLSLLTTTPLSIGLCAALLIVMFPVREWASDLFQGLSRLFQ